MKSLTKTPVTFEQAAKITQYHLGQDLAAFIELNDGCFNSAYRLDLSNGSVRVLKAAPPDQVRVMRYEQDIMKAEVTALELVRRNTGMPVPQVYVHDTSRAILDADYFIMDFVSGASFHSIRSGLPGDVQEAITRESARHLHQMNSLHGRSFGYLASPDQFPEWPACFDHMLTGVLEDGQDADIMLPLDCRDILDLARSHYRCLQDVTTPCLVHWDLWDGNIFIDLSTWQITGIIDFERALWGDPLMEVGFGAFGENPHFRAGYGEDLLAAPGAALRRTLYNLYLYLIMIIECTYRQYETSDQETWARRMLSVELEKLKDFA